MKYWCITQDYVKTDNTLLYTTNRFPYLTKVGPQRWFSLRLGILVSLEAALRVASKASPHMSIHGTGFLYSLKIAPPHGMDVAVASLAM